MHYGADNLSREYAYSPYGEATALGVDEGNSIQYTARENDQTGLYYYRARYYDPVLKRFIAQDPIGLGGGLNTYSYVRGNPVRFRDPTGNVGEGELLIRELAYFAHRYSFGILFEGAAGLAVGYGGTAIMVFGAGFATGYMANLAFETISGTSVGSIAYDWWGNDPSGINCRPIPRRYPRISPNADPGGYDLRTF